MWKQSEILPCFLLGTVLREGKKKTKENAMEKVLNFVLIFIYYSVYMMLMFIVEVANFSSFLTHPF